HQAEAPASEMPSEAEAPMAAPEAPAYEGEVPEYAAEASLSGAEGPVVASSNASVQEAQPASFEEQAPDVSEQEAAAVAPVPEDSLPAMEATVSGDHLPSGVAPESEDNLPVFAVEEVSEDGLPLLTAEPENAEDLAAIAQHEQAPADGAREALPPPAPPEASSEASPEPSPETTFEETSAALAASEPEAPFQAEEAASAAPEGQQAEPAESSPTAVSASLAPRSAEPTLTGRRFWQAGQVPVLGELIPALALVGAGTASRFTVGEGGFSALLDGELLTRLDGLVAFTGQVTFQPEMKRFRGRTTDKPFGEGSARMVRASGRGVLFIEPAGKRTFQAVDLGDESAYFRDECVFAFEEPVMFENGRVPSDMAPDLDLVHLRGDGKVLLSLEGPLRSVPVGMEAAVTVPLTHLVGWQGSLTPRVVSLLQGAEGEILKTAVELSGEGFALICLPVR
ncbi:MAG: AIM24 family protein, partial [Thermoanaerobaculia bacterium]